MEYYVATHTGPALPPEQAEKTVVNTKSKVDQNSLKFKPSDCPTHLQPIATYGDGNCFPRSLSVLVYGTQEHHAEMRGRITYEAVLNKETYISKEYLAKGATKQYRRANMSEVLVQYSEFYEVGQVLTPLTIERIYEEEVLQVAKNGQECGILQFFQAAGVLNRIVTSVYPEIGTSNINLRRDLNRSMHPRQDDAECTHDDSIYIMWTYLNRVGGTPNHFVPLLPLHETPLFEVMDSDEDWSIHTTDQQAFLEIVNMISL
jgi:hypothetical protein